MSHYVQKSELPGRRRRRRSYSSQCSSFEQKTIYSSKLYVLGFLPQALHDAAFPHLVSKKKENESSWAEVGRAIYGWFQTIFVSLSPRTLGKMNIGLEKMLHHHLVIKDRDPNQPWGSGERWRELLVPAGEDFCAVLSMMENGPWHHRSESWHESATLHLVTYGVSPNGIVCLLSFTVFQQWSRLLCFT